MNRTAWLAALALFLAPGSASAQMGGMMGGRGGMGMGGMGMGGMGMMGGFRSAQIRRDVQVEMEGGRKLRGRLALRGLMVQGDLGTYAIEPDRIKAIRFLKSPGEPGVVAEEAAPQQVPGAVGFGGGVNPNNPQNPPPVRAKVILDSGEEVVGNISYGMGFRLSVGYGAIVLKMDKLRTLTFGEIVKEPAPAASDGNRAAPKSAAGADRAGASEPPEYFRNGPNLIVQSRSGGRTVLYNMDRKQAIEFAGPKDGPLSIQPLGGSGLTALSIQGPKVGRIAVADATGWHVQTLREPADGGATPIIGPSIVVYSLGRHVYAYSVAAHRWDVAELPRDLLAQPVISPDGATIEADGHIYTFAPSTGRWQHVDVRAILDPSGTGEE